MLSSFQKNCQGLTMPPPPPPLIMHKVDQKWFISLFSMCQGFHPNNNVGILFVPWGL